MKMILRDTFTFVTLALLLTSCSFKSLYNQLDYLIPQYVEDMVTLDDVLEQQLDQRTRHLLSWHRNTQLPEYVAWFAELQQDVLAQPDRQQVLRHMEKLDTFWLSLSQQVNDHMAELLARLDARQQAQLFKNLAEKNADYRDEFVDVDEDERRQQFVERLEKNYQRWLDDLTEQQYRDVEQAAQQLMSIADLRLHRRERWQQGIQSILQSPGSVAAKRDQLRHFMKKYEHLDNAAMQKQADHNRRVIADLTVRIAARINAEQRSYFIEQTNDYMQIFRELNADSQPTPENDCCA